MQIFTQDLKELSLPVVSETVEGDAVGLELSDISITTRPDALFICTPLFADKDVAKLPLDTDC